VDAHSACRADIDAHFAGRGAVARERGLREHCLGCAPCRAYYERHLLLAELNPSALGVRERLARGLGLASRPHFLRATQLATRPRPPPLAASLGSVPSPR